MPSSIIDKFHAYLRDGGPGASGQGGSVDDSEVDSDEGMNEAESNHVYECAERFAEHTGLPADKVPHIADIFSKLRTPAGS
jgi:hypothetical protein